MAVRLGLYIYIYIYIYIKAYVRLCVIAMNQYNTQIDEQVKNISTSLLQFNRFHILPFECERM